MSLQLRWCGTAVVLMACTSGGGPADDTDTDVAAVGETRLAVRFDMDPDYVDALGDGEEPVGPFFGDLFLADDVTALGPNDGVSEVESLAVDQVDMRPTGAPTDVLWTSQPLAPGWYSILGFLDTDGNSTEGARDPDGGDPIALPRSPEFEAIEGETTVITVHFAFLYPS